MIYSGMKPSFTSNLSLGDANTEVNRSSDPTTRKSYVSLVEAVQHKGGEVVIFSSMHESGQRE